MRLGSEGAGGGWGRRGRERRGWARAGGTRLCHFYETRQDLLDILIPYFRAGLEAREFCVWVVAEFTVEEARDALRRGIPGAERHLSAGDMQIIPHAEWYLKGGTFDAERVTGDWGGKMD